MTHHFRDAERQHKSHGGSWSGPDFSAGFHDFAAEWSPERIVWFVDGQERFRSEDSIPKGKMFLLLNLAVGGDWPGSPDDQTQFPAALEVKYVRVYQKAQ
jgi:beta-glucanase (GH16 family)